MENLNLSGLNCTCPCKQTGLTLRETYINQLVEKLNYIRPKIRVNVKKKELKCVAAKVIQM